MFYDYFIWKFCCKGSESGGTAGMIMVETGIVFGRFQMLHLGHMEYLLEAKKLCKHLVIGVSNPDPGVIKYDEACPHRSADTANPLTFYERLQMIAGAMLEAGVDRSEFTIVPMPINYPDRIRYYVPEDGEFFLTIYDDWGWERKKIIENLGYKVTILWIRTDDTRVSSGTEIRQMMMDGEDWSHLAPPAVYRFAKEHHLAERIRGEM